jgi:hypothetical protein
MRSVYEEHFIIFQHSVFIPTTSEMIATRLHRFRIPVSSEVLYNAMRTEHLARRVRPEGVHL